MSQHKYPIGQLCVIVMSINLPEYIGRQCTVVKHAGMLEGLPRYHVEIQFDPDKWSLYECSIRPVKPGDLPDFAEEETELDEEMVA
jgi:hypothetical protein